MTGRGSLLPSANHLTQFTSSRNKLTFPSFFSIFMSRLQILPLYYLRSVLMLLLVFLAYTEGMQKNKTVKWIRKSWLYLPQIQNRLHLRRGQGSHSIFILVGNICSPLIVILIKTDKHDLLNTIGPIVFSRSCN